MTPFSSDPQFEMEPAEPIEGLRQGVSPRMLLNIVSAVVVIGVVALGLRFVVGPQIQRTFAEPYHGTSVYVAQSDGWLVALKVGDGAQIWRAHLGTGINTFQLRDGVIFATANTDTEKTNAHAQHVLAVRASDGQTLWQFAIPILAMGIVGIGDGTVVVNETDTIPNATSTQFITGIDSMTGEIRWRFHGEEAAEAAMIDLAHHLVIVSATNDPRHALPHSLTAIDLRSGNVVWNMRLISMGGLALREIINDTLLTNDSASVMALDLTSGITLWQRSIGRAFSIRRCDSFTGPMACVASSDGAVAALSLDDGSQVWRDQVRDRAFTGALSVINNQLLVNFDGSLAVLGMDGSVIWQGSLLPFYSIALPTYAGGYLYGNEPGVVQAIRFGDGKQRWTFVSYATAGSQPLAHGDTIYLGLDNYLFALDATKGTLLWKSSLSSAAYLTPIVSDTQGLLPSRSNTGK